MSRHLNRELFADAAQIDLQDVGKWLRRVRSARDPETKKLACRNYLKMVFMLADIAEIAERMGWTDPVFQPQQPIPIREQLVGLSAEERRALEWKPYSEEFSHA